MPAQTGPRYQNFQIHSSAMQEHATQFDGTQGRGLFKQPLAQTIVAIVGQADGNVDWTLEIELPQPDGTPGVKALIETVTAQANYYKALDLDLPARANLLLSTTAGTNIKGQTITRLLEERYS